MTDGAGGTANRPETVTCVCGGTIRACACGAWHCPGWQHAGGIVNHSHWCLAGARYASPR